MKYAVIKSGKVINIIEIEENHPLLNKMDCDCYKALDGSIAVTLGQDYDEALDEFGPYPEPEQED